MPRMSRRPCGPTPRGRGREREVDGAPDLLAPRAEHRKRLMWITRRAASTARSSRSCRCLAARAVPALVDAAVAGASSLSLVQALLERDALLLARRDRLVEPHALVGHGARDALGERDRLGRSKAPVEADHHALLVEDVADRLRRGREQRARRRLLLVEAVVGPPRPPPPTATRARRRRRRARPRPSARRPASSGCSSSTGGS